MALVEVRGFIYFLMLTLATTNLQAEARQLKQEGGPDLAGGRGHKVGGCSTYGNGRRTYYNKPSTPRYPPKPPPPPPPPSARATSSPPECPSGYLASPPAVDTSAQQLPYSPPLLSNGSRAIINTPVNINGVMDPVMPLVLCYDIGQLGQQLAAFMSYLAGDMVMAAAAGFVL